jgi:hypothetical protein
MKKFISSILGLLLLLMPAAAQVVTGFGNFSPINGAGQGLSGTTTSASVTFTAGTPAGTNTVLNATDVMLYNSGTTLAFCRWGVGAQTAVATDVPIPAGTVQVFFKGVSDTVACIMASGTATIYVMPGNGR